MRQGFPQGLQLLLRKSKKPVKTLYPKITNSAEGLAAGAGDCSGTIGQGGGEPHQPFVPYTHTQQSNIKGAKQEVRDVPTIPAIHNQGV